MSTAVIDHLTEIWETPHATRGWFSTMDHKELGKRYLATAMIFLVIGGIEAFLLRLQLARADQSLLTPEAYDQIFTMHSMTMIFWYASPMLSGFSIFLIPLMIGARDMAFPRANAFSYWVFLASGIFLYVSLVFRQGRMQAGSLTRRTPILFTRRAMAWISMLWPCCSSRFPRPSAQSISSSRSSGCARRV